MGKKRILIIDDEVSFTSQVKLNLEDAERYEVRVENMGKRGLSSARQYRPDLILMDIVMPDMEGSQVSSQIKADEKLENIPIVFLTAGVTREEVAFEGGIIAGHSFITKPISITELMDCIEKNLGRKEWGRSTS